MNSAQAAPPLPGFYGDAPDETHPWAVHDRNRPQPTVITPGTFSTPEVPGKPPSDAIVLFGGADGDLSKWSSDKNPDEATKWEVVDGALQCVPGSGYIRTKEEFGDCQLHVEWAAPAKVEGDSQGRGNSGVFLMGMMEIQVLDNYNNPSYADGMAGSMYGVNPPAVNALRPPGEWQSYDIVFRRPVYDGDIVLDPGYVTVFVNGVLVQDHTPIEGPTGHKARVKAKPFPEKGPFKLQDHGNPVRYRNIWYRPLPKRVVEGGLDGKLSEETTAAKRAEIAKMIVEDASKLEGRAKWLRMAESLIYHQDEAVLEKLSKVAEEQAAKLDEASDADLEAKKGEILEANNALQYLIKFDRIPADFPLAEKLAAIVKQKEWDKKK
ncbi:3-keto-disaccharide hydrolase [Phragmitibacter flavus]|nr:DUF1080 domain-containing protein [Phragmitibacter flavus]